MEETVAFEDFFVLFCLSSESLQLLTARDEEEGARESGE